MSAEPIVRDSVTGGVVDALGDQHFVKVIEDGVAVLHLSPAVALELAQRLISAAVAMLVVRA